MTDDTPKGTYWKVLEQEKKVLEPEHPNTLISIKKLGLALDRQRKYGEAEAMHRRALRDRKKVLEPEYPDTLTSINLGWVLAARASPRMRN